MELKLTLLATIGSQEGNLWRGFTSMVCLGIEHMKEGTDHLLFLITLLLPATLIARNKQWYGFGGVKYSFIRILKIVIAFTIGHSITFLICALGVFHFPTRPIEVLIALGIFISAIHALKPIFPGREMFIAAGFGLIHWVHGLFSPKHWSIYTWTAYASPSVF